jgi:hypothetical protein
VGLGGIGVRVGVGVGVWVGVGVGVGIGVGVVVGVLLIFVSVHRCFCLFLIQFIDIFANFLLNSSLFLLIFVSIY